MNELRCWFCETIINDITLYICKQCIKERRITNLEAFLVRGIDRIYYEYWRDQANKQQLRV